MRRLPASLVALMALPGCGDGEGDACTRTCVTGGAGALASIFAVESEGAAEASAVVVASGGDLVVLGEAGKDAVTRIGSVEVGPGPRQFLARVGPDGAVRWVTLFDAPGLERAHLAADDAGQFHVAGVFRGTLTFGDLSLTATDGDDDGFLASFDHKGRLSSAQAITGDSVDITDITGRASGVTIVGSVLGPMNVGGATLPDGGGFIVDLDAGLHSWHHSITASGRVSVDAITRGEDGSLWVASRGVSMLDIGDDLPVSGEGWHWYLSRHTGYDGHVLESTLHTGHVEITALAHDPKGGLAITGLAFDALDLGAVTLPAMTAETPFVARLDPDAAPLWAAHLQVDQVASVAIAATGTVAVQGNASDTPMFGALPPPEPPPCPISSPFIVSPSFVATYAPDGAPRWYHGTQLRSGTIALDGDNVLLAGGQINDLWLSGCFHHLRDRQDAVVLRFVM